MLRTKKESCLQKLKIRWQKHLRELREQDPQAGASLIEILVAVSIIVILASAIGLSVFRYIGQAKVSMAKQHISTISTAIDSYLLENFAYPEEGNLNSAIGPFLSGGKVPPDPWGTAYIYHQPGENGRPFDLISAGEDKSEGTEDDIVSWDLNKTMNNTNQGDDGQDGGIEN